MFSNPFVFYGRIRRKEFGLSLLIYAAVFIFIIVQAADRHKEIYLLALFPLAWFRFAQGAKRSHDLGNTGWYQLIPFYTFWMLLADGQTGVNQYGENQKVTTILITPIIIIKSRWDRPEPATQIVDFK